MSKVKLAEIKKVGIKLAYIDIDFMSLEIEEKKQNNQSTIYGIHNFEVKAVDEIDKSDKDRILDLSDSNPIRDNIDYLVILPNIEKGKIPSHQIVKAYNDFIKRCNENYNEFNPFISVTEITFSLSDEAEKLYKKHKK